MTMIDNWKIFVHLAKIQKNKKIRQAKIRKTIATWHLNKGK